MPRKPNSHLTPAAVEATATAFLAAFKALPAKAKGRFVELLDDYEEELDLREVEAARVANPADFDPKNALTIEEYIAQRQARSSKNSGNQSLAA